jgi:hypothetical protein
MLTKYSFFDLCQLRKCLCQIELDEIFRLRLDAIVFSIRIDRYRPNIGRIEYRDPSQTQHYDDRKRGVYGR